MPGPTDKYSKPVLPDVTEMDSIFDDGGDEVGGETEAYCPSSRCKADTTHTIISMYEDEIRRVQCVVCGDVHAYRKPRGESFEEPALPPVRKKTLTQKPSWEEAMAQVTEKDLTNCRPYSIRDTYEELDIVSHPTFDVGFVTELLPDNKVEVTFKEGPRILVHNRADLSARMPAIAEIPAPREQRRRKKKKSSDFANRLAGGNDGPDDAEALARAHEARTAAAEKLAEEKRKLERKLAAEQIRAKRQRTGSEDTAKKAKKTKRAAAKGTGSAAKERGAKKKPGRGATPRSLGKAKQAGKKKPAKKSASRSAAKKATPGGKSKTSSRAATQKAAEKKAKPRPVAAKKSTAKQAARRGATKSPRSAAARKSAAKSAKKSARRRT